MAQIGLVKRRRKGLESAFLILSRASRLGLKAESLERRVGVGSGGNGSKAPACRRASICLLCSFRAFFRLAASLAGV